MNLSIDTHLFVWTYRMLKSLLREAALEKDNYDAAQESCLVLSGVI